eukprot:893116-Pleurochrysis_carterae.AAC.3
MMLVCACASAKLVPRQRVRLALLVCRIKHACHEEGTAGGRSHTERAQELIVRIEVKRTSTHTSRVDLQ